MYTTVQQSVSQYRNINFSTKIKLRAYCTFASKQAVSITLFGLRPDNKDSKSVVLKPPKLPMNQLRDPVRKKESCN